MPAFTKVQREKILYLDSCVVAKGVSKFEKSDRRSYLAGDHRSDAEAYRKLSRWSMAGAVVAGIAGVACDVVGLDAAAKLLYRAGGVGVAGSVVLDGFANNELLLASDVLRLPVEQ